MFLSECKDSVEIGTLAEEVDGDDGFGFWGDFGFGIGKIDVETDGAGVDEDGGGTDAADATGGSEEGKGGDKHFITGADVEGHEGEKDGVGAGGDANAMSRFRKSSEFILHLGHFFAHDEMPGLEYALESRVELGLERVVLGVDVEKGNHEKTE